MARRCNLSSDVPIGAHVTGGIKGAVSRALEIGAGPMQIFIGSPQTWKDPSPAADDLASFVRGVREHRLGPVFVHSSYLVNLAAGRPETHERSVRSLALQLRLADSVDAAGLIFHPGSAGAGAPPDAALGRVVTALEAVLDGYDGRARLLLEVCAGQGETIGDRFSELADILGALSYDRRLGICWDTCHLFNAGYDVSTKRGLARTVSEFENLIGFEWLLAIHANDSKTPFNARRDRHENIGEGHIGRDAFRRMLAHPALRRLPWILEVPGFEHKGPDRANIEILKRLARA
jgi:deoxyribonuclease-4